MILPKHPDLMSDAELHDWVIDRVKRKQPETIFLDYKETIATGSRDEKLEMAKDVTSFANESGGVILYGIPEERVNGLPIPVDMKDIGVDPIPGLCETVENILVDVVTPKLPELRIREIALPHLTNKVVYLVWHPESWDAPHMIHGYNQKRYYKRGNFRAMMMEEADVERLYIRRQSRLSLANDFFAKLDAVDRLNTEQEPLIRLVVCPAIPTENRIDFSSNDTTEWLRKNYWHDLDWYPFVSGVRSGWQRELRQPNSGLQTLIENVTLFHNGAAAIHFDAPLDHAKDTFDGIEFLKVLDEFLKLVGKLYRLINMVGEVSIDVVLVNYIGVIYYSGVYGGRLGNPLIANSLNWLDYRIVTRATDLFSSAEALWRLEKRVMDRLAQCFGKWEAPHCFHDNGKPAI